MTWQLLGELWEGCEGRDWEQGGSRTRQVLGRTVNNHLDWRRVIAGIQETDGELQRWAKLIFNNTNSAQFGPAMTLLLPTPSVALQKHIPTSSAKRSQAQQRRGKTLWDTRFAGKGVDGMKKAVPVIPSSCRSVEELLAGSQRKPRRGQRSGRKPAAAGVGKGACSGIAVGWVTKEGQSFPHTSEYHLIPCCTKQVKWEHFYISEVEGL